MTTFESKQFMKNYELKESDLSPKLNLKICPGDSKITTQKGFVKIDDGSLGCTHWTCFWIRDRNSFYFNSLGGSPVSLLQQLPKPINFYISENQNIYSRLGGTYCLYSSYLMKSLKSYDAVLENCFGLIKIIKNLELF